MPIYEYTCNQCGAKFDQIRPMSDADAPIECKHCQSKDTRRALSRCYSKSDTSSAYSSTSTSGGGCSGCSGGSCSGCHH